MRLKLWLFSTLVVLAGCSTTPSVITVRELPSPELLAECAEPKARVATNADLAWTIIEYRKALRLCNVDKKALREWSNNGQETIKP